MSMRTPTITALAAAMVCLLYELTEQTGDKKYAREADRALAFFFNRCQSPETGLMAWGEHLYWDFHKEAWPPPGDRLHPPQVRLREVTVRLSMLTLQDRVDVIEW